jgi:hypothetical protein
MQFWKPEHETSYNGPLSSGPEWHALIIGIEAGLRDEVTDRMTDHEDVKAEGHWFSAGFVLATIGSSIGGD